MNAVRLHPWLFVWSALVAMGAVLAALWHPLQAALATLPGGMDTIEGLLLAGLALLSLALAALWLRRRPGSQACALALETRWHTAQQNLAHLQASLNAVPELLLELDGEGLVLDIRAMRDDLKLLPAALRVGADIRACLPLEAIQAYDSALRQAREQGWSQGQRYRLLLPNGIRWFELSVGCCRGLVEATDRFVVLPRDITVQVGMQTSLELATQVFEQSHEAFLIANSDERVIRINRAFTKITGYTEDDVLGKVCRVAGPQRMDRSQQALIWNELQTHNHWEGETWNFRKDGTRYPQWVSVHCVRDAQGLITHFVGVFRDISQTRQTQAHIEKLAHYDGLTGLPNRQLMAERVNRLIAQSPQHAMALLCLDLDHFKNINDSLGHRMGDQILLAVSQRLRDKLRPQDILARPGADEFFVLLPDSTAEQASALAAQLLLQMAPVYEMAHHELSVKPSIGIALYPADGANFEALAQRADAAMHQAKREGRNRFCVFTTDIQARTARSLQLENALRRALERQQLQLYYQPQIGLQDGRITGAEALLRWHHPELGEVSPAEFIPIAEESGLILPIGEWVLGTAAAQLKQWLDEGMHPIIMGVNLSAVQFRQNRLPEQIADMLRDAGLPAERLELELTEGVAVREPQRAMATMQALRSHGIRLAIDDFGTGYSSLSYLKRFPIARLKIDKSFVQELSAKPEDRAIVSAIIRMAAELGLRTIAEGVETQAQLELLRQKGCDEAQGFWFSKPLPAPAFREFVRQHAPAA